MITKRKEGDPAEYQGDWNANRTGVHAQLQWDQIFRTRFRPRVKEETNLVIIRG